MVAFLETENRLSIQQIEEVELLSGNSFPQQYKTHMLKYNGGRCKPNKFSFVEGEKLSSSCVDWFLAIYDGKYDNLKSYIINYKLNKKRLPTHLMPIAHDPGGNLICISCGEKDYGYVYFWDHEKEVDYSRSDDKDYSNLYLIAKSFDEFINGLKET
ncbi:MAG: SMI1/KNR4 family protein [Bacteroidota bacterium]